MSYRRMAVINLAMHGIGMVRRIGNVGFTVGRLGVMSKAEYRAWLNTQKWAEGLSI